MLYNRYIKEKGWRPLNKEDLQKLWKKILIDEGFSETEFWRSRGVSQPAGNRKLREGTIKYIEFINILESLGYKVSIEKKGE